MIEKDEAKKKLERRLKQAFPEKWELLSEKEKEFALERFYLLARPARVTAKETIDTLVDRTLTFNTIFFGAVLAILAGLTVNIIDRALLRFGLYYEIITPVVLVLLAWVIYRLFQKSIIDDYRDNNFLDELLEGYNE